MNKKLVAVAVAGVLAAPLAAQAQTANVTLYGRLNVDYELVTGRQADGSNPNVSRLSSNSSRIGVRGTESLGGGLNAIFQIESNVLRAPFLRQAVHFCLTVVRDAPPGRNSFWRQVRRGSNIS